MNKCERLSCCSCSEDYVHIKKKTNVQKFLFHPSFYQKRTVGSKPLPASVAN